MGSEGLHVMVSVVLRVLHLQRHDLLLLAVCKVIGRTAPLRRQPVASHFVTLVTLVVKGCKGEDVEEEERCSHSHRHTELCGIVPGVSRKEVLGRSIRSLRFGVRGEGRVGVASGTRTRRPGPRSVGAGTRTRTWR